MVVISAWEGRGVVGPPLGTRRCGDVMGDGFFAAGCRVIRRAAGVGGMLAAGPCHQGGVVQVGNKAILSCLLQFWILFSRFVPRRRGQIFVDVNLCVSSHPVFFCK